MAVDYSKITKWKDKTIIGSTFPDAPYRTDLKPVLEKEITEKYIPELKKFNPTKGFELLLIAMTDKEGFYKGTRSFKSNNPGNIGNTDSGKNRVLDTLEKGIQLQIDYINNMIAGKNKNFPLGKEKIIKPFYSAEIAKNANSYKLSPWLPGYKFIFTGQLDQFVKIYSTGARGGNNYVNTIVGYFKANGLTITPESKIQDIIQMK